MSTSGAPEVSVVMGVRNGAADLAATLDNILGQRAVDLELIVVDDGSTDATPDILAEYAGRDSRLRPCRQEPGGLTEALARGCGLARAPLIARHDVGDRSHPQRLEAQKAILDHHPGVALVSSWTACLGPGGEPLFIERKGGEDDREVAILAESAEIAAGPTSHGSTMFRASTYRMAGGYRPEFALGQDWDLWLRIAALGRFWKLGRTLYSRKLAPGSLSFAFHDLQVQFGELARASARHRMAGEDEAAVLRRAASLSLTFDSLREQRARRGRALGAYHVGELLRRNSDPRCRTYLRSAAFGWPPLLRAQVRLLQSYVRRHGEGPLDPPSADAWAGAPWTPSA